MKTKERSSELPETTRPTTIESVTFRDGMIVTADDLDAAMRYPTSLLLTVNRAFFGCGVVCGLELRPKSTGGWVLCVDPGVAIDCRGYPIELCSSVELDLSPEACACEPPPDKVCIAVKRTTSDAAPRDACGCDLDAPQFDCRRVRDHVVVKVFTEPEITALADRVCRRDPADATPVCDALTACSSCSCGASWILLGCVSLKKEEGIVGAPDTSGKRWVKPVAALCAGVIERLAAVETTLAGYEPKESASQPAAPPEPPPATEPASGSLSA